MNLVLFLLLEHVPITASNQNLTQAATATDALRQNVTGNPQNLFDLRSHFENRTRLFENQSVQSASEVEKSIIKSSSNPSTSQQRHLVRSPKKESKQNSSKGKNTQSSTAPQIQSTNTCPDWSICSGQSPNPEFTGSSTVVDESSNPVPVDERRPLLANEERLIVDELRQLDQRNSALNEQVSIIFHLPHFMVT